MTPCVYVHHRLCQNHNLLNLFFLVWSTILMFIGILIEHFFQIYLKHLAEELYHLLPNLDIDRLYFDLQPRFLLRRAFPVISVINNLAQIVKLVGLRAVEGVQKHLAFRSNVLFNVYNLN